MKSNPEIYIIIINYNSWQDTTECITSLVLSSFEDFQIILVDNHSPNHSEAYLKQFFKGEWQPEIKNDFFKRPNKHQVLPYVFYEVKNQQVTRDFEKEKRTQKTNSGLKHPILFIQTKKNLGFAGGNNIALDLLVSNMELPDSQKVFLLNPDTRVEKNTLTELNKTNTSYFISSCAIKEYEDPSKLCFYGAYRFIKPFGIIKPIKNLKERDQIDYIYGGALFTTVGTIRKNGLLPSEYFLYWEETDWGYQAKKNGIELILNENAIVYDKVGTSIGRGYLAHYYFIRNGFLFYKKYFKYYLPTLFIFNGVRYLNKLRKQDYKSAKAILHGTKDFFKGKKGHTPIG